MTRIFVPRPSLLVYVLPLPLPLLHDMFTRLLNLFGLEWKKDGSTRPSSNQGHSQESQQTVAQASNGPAAQLLAQSTGPYAFFL